MVFLTWLAAEESSMWCSTITSNTEASRRNWQTDRRTDCQDHYWANAR